MFTNKLILNPDKTEFILIGSKNNRKQLTFRSIFSVIWSHQHKVLGTSELCSILILRPCVTGHTRNLYRIRPLLDLNTSVLLANALVSSRLDYCNFLFLSLIDFELRRLQLVQNTLCRVDTHSSIYSHITPQLKNSIGSQSNIGYNSK